MSPLEPGRPVYVWDRLVRVTHWVIFWAIVVLSATGIYIGHPFLVVRAPAAAHFVTGTIRVIHFYAAIAFSLAVVARVVWMFTGPTYARWKQFIPVEKERRRGLGTTLQFYLFLQRKPPDHPGHNPLAGLAYTLVFGLYGVMIATGLAMYAAQAAVGSPLRWFAFLSRLFGGLQYARFIHHGVMWLLIAFVVHHVYSAILTSAVEKNGEIDSIFSGYKILGRRDG
jgi:Ni/Fe-hydrogenase 1 B-type cytochrome subunit